MRVISLLALSLTVSSAWAAEPAGFSELNLKAGRQVIYEVQVRSANACDPSVGSDEQKAACAEKIAPKQRYRAEGMSCDIIDDLHRIKLGTFEDMLAPTADFRRGITTRYIQEKVGANVIWLMPIFPNNDQWNIPDACDNTGSPYAVRDYLHVRASLSQECILAGRDGESDEPCWGTASLKKMIDDAHAKGTEVWLDLAFNHFGHNYIPYDYTEYTSVVQRLQAGLGIDGLWDFDATYEEALLDPAILDSSAQLDKVLATDSEDNALYQSLVNHCGADLPKGQELLRLFSVWKMGFPHEREQISCQDKYLESLLPGFYLGSDQWNPSSRLGDNYSNNWRDVKFLYHHESNAAHYFEFVRNREYLFRVINYWTALGIDGFRLDHTTDHANGLDASPWKYICSKMKCVAAKRGQNIPVYLAEEFHSQMAMNKVVDVMIEGYVGDMNGRNVIKKDTAHVERVVRNMDRFSGKTYVMSALETHDEHRLTDGTGFSPWTGAGFWSVGLSTWSTPMLLMGQEFGESYGLGFRRADYLRARFDGHPNSLGQTGEDLRGFYQRLISKRLDSRNRALIASNRHFLRNRFGYSHDGIFAQMKWSGDGNVVFVFNNLWQKDVNFTYNLPESLARRVNIQDHLNYRLYDVISDAQVGPCHSGINLRDSLHVIMDSNQLTQWLRLELCQ